MLNKPIEDVLKAYTGQVMSLSGVVGTAQGECAGKPCILVFVVEKTSDLMKQIPSEIEGFHVLIDETGPIKGRCTPSESTPPKSRAIPLSGSRLS